MDAEYHIQKANDYLETLHAILILEYHDKNYLDRTLAANNNTMNVAQRNLVNLALGELEKSKRQKEITAANEQ
jgi:hypothetical protein